MLFRSIDRTERRLEEELCCEAVIHMDPVQTDYEIDILKARLRTVLDRIDASILFHDFRTTESGGGTLLHFDLLVPYDYSMPDEELTDLVQEYISRFIGPQYSADIRVDKSYADRSGAR